MKTQRKRGELGQILMLTVLLIPVLVAMTGLAIDVGTYAANRRSLQNAADGAALAAGQDLPDSSAATASALDYASSHGVDPTDVNVTITGGTSNPTVQVEIERNHEFAFMKIVGVNSKSVGASATAAKYSFGGGAGVVPWSVTQDTIDAASSGDEVTIKYDANANYGAGNFGAIRIDGSGGSTYEDAARYGSDQTICSALMPNCAPSDCPGTFPSTCSESAPECDGAECTPETGNLTGPTHDAVDFRIDYTSDECDTFDEAFSPRNAFAGPAADGSYFGGRLAAPAPGHGGGGHETYTPTRTPTRTSTPVPTSTPLVTNTPAVTNTPGATSTPGTPVATSTLGPTITPGPVSTEEYGLNPQCNPWTGGECATPTSDCSRRVFLIPVVNDFGNGSSDPQEIQGFALVFLEGYNPPCTGNSCEIRARFVRAQFTSGFFAGDYDPNATTHFVKLIQ